jgi:MEMO1 family protein
MSRRKLPDLEEYMIRQPAVAGQFYPGHAERLREDVNRYLSKQEKRSAVIGIVAPHAGYIYSGRVAGAVYGCIEIPRVMVILCPNHHGIGAQAALSPAQAWATPLGAIPVEPALRQQLLAYAPSLLALDALAHLHEHSLEVQLPFLQVLRPDVAIVPVSLGFGDYASCRLLGEALAQAIRSFPEPVLIVASSDMTHYEAAADAKMKDDLALHQILEMNPVELLAVCRDNAITMCGVVPTAVMLIAARLLGATGAHLVDYATSGEVTGDYRQVVAYAALTVS